MSGIVQAHASKAHAKARTIYLSGPMTGLPEFNYPAFHRAAAALRAMGYTVYSPAEYHKDLGGAFPLRQAMADFCRFICEQADTVVVLPGWRSSKGARIEVDLALYCAISVLHIDALLAPVREEQPA